MHEPHTPPDPHQTAFVFEEAGLSLSGTAQVNEAVLPFWTMPPEFAPVYTVFLRRSAVLSVEERPTLRTPANVAALVWECLQETDRETFVVILLDTKTRVIGLNVASIGILDSALVHPREIFKAAILANAANIIIAHNHPSGDPTPSAEDKHVTKRLADAGKVLGIELLDHIIVGSQTRFVSFKDQGYL